MGGVPEGSRAQLERHTRRVHELLRHLFASCARSGGGADPEARVARLLERLRALHDELKAERERLRESQQAGGAAGQSQAELSARGRMLLVLENQINKGLVFASSRREPSPLAAWSSMSGPGGVSSASVGRWIPAE